MNSIKLLIKHGVDVNKCIAQDTDTSEQNGNAGQDKKGVQKLNQLCCGPRTKSQKRFDPLNGSPESLYRICFIFSSKQKCGFLSSCLLW